MDGMALGVQKVKLYTFCTLQFSFLGVSLIYMFILYVHVQGIYMYVYMYTCGSQKITALGFVLCCVALSLWFLNSLLYVYMYM